MKEQSGWLNHPVSRIIQHLAFWVLSFVTFLHLFKSGMRAEWIDYVYTALFHGTLIPAVYLNLVLVRRILEGNRIRIWYLPAIALVIFAFAALNYSFFQYWSQKILIDYFFISYFTFWQVSLFFVVYIAITSLLKFSKSWFRIIELQHKLLQTEKEKVQVELMALKSQVNPHFFFNTLNGIYSMSLDKDERLPGTVLKLSDLMRYFLYESRKAFVPLGKELKVLRDYIDLQKIRSDALLEVSVQNEGEVNGQMIAPLLLITFLENAFKHGAKGSQENAYIRLHTRVDPGNLVFELENNKGTIDRVDLNDYKGVGLDNVKRQLELLYPGKHVLTVKDEPDHFSIKLQLTL